MVRRSLGAVAVCTAAISVLRPATAVAETTNDRWKVPQCATIGVGAATVQTLGTSYGVETSTLAPAIEGGYGYCGPFVEASLRLRFLRTSDLFMLQPGVHLRLHTQTPEHSGLEAGAALRFGYNYLNVTSTGPIIPGLEPPVHSWEPFDAFGIVLGGGADVRYWLDARWGLVLAADVSLAIAGQAYSRDDSQGFSSLAVTGGGVVRF